MADLKTHVAAAWQSTLSSALAPGATTINVTDTTGSPTVPFYAVIEPGNDAKRETVLVDAGKTSTTFTLTSASSRGKDGSSDVQHDPNVTIAVVPSAVHITDLHDRVDAQAAALTAHEGAADPHPGFLTETEGNAAYEAKVDRTGATAGEVPTLQADNTLAFAAVGGSVTSEGFRAYRSTAQTLSAATYTKITFDTEVRDEGADYDTATGEWTVPATGWYDVGGHIFYGSLTDGDQIVAAVYVNGIRSSFLGITRVGSAGGAGAGGAIPLHLTAGDVVTLYGYRQSAGDVSAGSDWSYFTAKRRF